MGRYVTMILFICLVSMSLAYAETATTGASIGNAAPSASSVTVSAGNLASDDIFLTANSTTELNVTATITDNNGCTEITTVNATLFRTNYTNGHAGVADNRSHYTMQCGVGAGECTGEGDITAQYNCRVNITWYLDATDSGSYDEGTNWTINVSPHDDSGLGTTATAVHDVATLTSLNLLNTSIDFGSLSLGQNTTTTNQNITILNLGNEPLDVNINGHALAVGDNLSMDCTIGNISLDNLEYSSTNFTYGAGTYVNGSGLELDLDIDRGDEATHNPNKSVAFGFAIPSSGVSGNCSGNLVIVAVSDPTTD